MNAEELSGTRTDAVLELSQVTKRFGSVVAVEEIDISVQRGEIITLLGPSGSGKTTMLRMIAGFARPTSGTIAIDGIDAAPLSPSERLIGFVFQQHALFPHMTVGDNIRYPLKRRKWPRDEQEARLQEMLSLIQLPGFENRYPRQLSGGQQQRIALARALAFRPRFLLMDEPLGALDRALRFELAEEIRRIQRETGATIVYVTHDQEEALTLSDRIAVMRRGHIVQVGTPEELFERPVESFIAQFLGECNLLPAEAWTLRGDGYAETTVFGQQIVVQACGQLGPETEAVVIVRPMQLSIDPAQPFLRMKARTVELLYLGETVRMRFKTPEGVELVGAVSAQRARDIKIGDDVLLGVTRKDVVLVPRTEPPTDQELSSE